MNNYQEEALRSAQNESQKLEISVRFLPSTIDLIHAQLGISSEAGEFAGACKKHFIYGQSLDVANVKEELGDLCWYIALGAHAINFPLAEVMADNIAKLKLRYPEKFTEKDALERKDKECQNCCNGSILIGDDENGITGTCPICNGSGYTK